MLTSNSIILSTLIDTDKSVWMGTGLEKMKKTGPVEVRVSLAVQGTLC